MNFEKASIAILVVSLVAASFVIGLLLNGNIHFDINKIGFVREEEQSQQIFSSNRSTTTEAFKQECLKTGSNQECEYKAVLMDREAEAAKIRADLNISTVYEVKKGDTLDTIARMFGVTKQSIITINKLQSKNIGAGDTLIIPSN